MDRVDHSAASGKTSNVHTSLPSSLTGIAANAPAVINANAAGTKSESLLMEVPEIFLNIKPVWAKSVKVGIANAHRELLHSFTAR